MRDKLRAIDGVRGTFRATFVQYGQRTSYGYIVPMALFRNVRNEAGEEVCDHIWLRRGKLINALGLDAGDEILFDGRAMPYRKGYGPFKETDWGLKHPRNFRRLVQESCSMLPLFRRKAA